MPAQHDYRPLLLHNLALVDASLGDLTAARRKHARAIEMWEQASGRDHPFIAVALTELASVLRERGAPADALPLLERALAIRENSLGSNHRDTARTLANLAATLSQTGQNDRAQEFASRALAVWEHTDTVDAPDRATVLKLYAQLQLSRGALGDARRYFERALAIRQKAFGPSHPDVADVRANLAMTQARMGEHAEALSTAMPAETSGRDHLRLISRYPGAAGAELRDKPTARARLDAVTHARGIFVDRARRRDSQSGPRARRDGGATPGCRGGHGCPCAATCTAQVG